jgi:hypothetical protein
VFDVIADEETQIKLQISEEAFTWRAMRAGSRSAWATASR